MAITRHGVEPTADLSPNLIRRPEVIPLSKRLPAMVAASGGFIMLGVAALMLLFPKIGDIFLLLGVIAYFYCKKHQIDYPFQTPFFDRVKGKRKNGKGLFFLGNNQDDATGIFFSDSDMRTHMLVMGSTGSGKTRFLLGLLYQAMLVGSGAMYVDGKADNSVFWWVYSLCRRLGREDDLLVINYLTGGETMITGKSAGVRGNNEILSNTMNPFSSGTSEQLRSMVVGLMRDSGGDGDMWKGRASALLAGSLRCLAYLRDENFIQLSVSSIRDSLPLDIVLRMVHGKYNGNSVVELGDNRVDMSQIKFPDYAIRPLKKYLLDLPGYSDQDVANDDIAPECYKQHGFLTMQLTEALGDLGETYGHIFNVPIGEVDFRDVVFNRRILFVMLPALERDPDALANLGKLVVSGVRSALGPALGDKLEGTRRDVIEVKPTNSEVPFMLILDEYGYYSVKGFAVVAAQARSLGVSIVFAGQDYPSFKKGSEEEAASTVANTNIKICMKLEDPSDTLDIFKRRAGQALTSTTSGFERKDGKMKYSDQNSIRFEEKDRINVRDLVSQDPGQGHVIFKDTMIRTNLFAILTKSEASEMGLRGVDEVDEAELNRFLMVRPPAVDKVQKFTETYRRIETAFRKGKTVGGNQQEQAADNLIKRTDVSDSALMTLAEDLREALKRGANAMDAGIQAVGVQQIRKQKLAEGKPKTQEGQEKDPFDAAEEALNEEQNRKTEQSQQRDTQKTAPRRSQMDQFNDMLEDEIGLFDQDEEQDSNLSDMASDAHVNFEKLLDEALVDENGENISVRQRLERVAFDFYNDEDRAEEDADEAIKILDKRLNYPKPPVPRKEAPSKVSARLRNLTSILSRKQQDDDEAQDDQD